MVNGSIADIPTEKKEQFDFDKDEKDYQKVADLLGIRKEDIKSINILKDTDATAFYGGLGRNGVIEIQTKK